MGGRRAEGSELDEVEENLGGDGLGEGACLL